MQRIIAFIIIAGYASHLSAHPEYDARSIRTIRPQEDAPRPRIIRTEGLDQIAREIQNDIRARNARATEQPLAGQPPLGAGLRARVRSIGLRQRNDREQRHTPYVNPRNIAADTRLTDPVLGINDPRAQVVAPTGGRGTARTNPRQRTNPENPETRTARRALDL